MIVLQVKDPTIHERTGETNGRPWSIREQECWVKLGDEVRRVRLRLKAKAEAYKPGVYTLSPESFYVDRFGGLGCFPLLVPAASK